MELPTRPSTRIAALPVPAILALHSPPPLYGVSATGGGVNDGSSRTVSWTLGTVPVGAPASVPVTVEVSPAVSAGATVLNQAAYAADLKVATPAVAVTAIVL